jgi:hypothetical protein
MVFIGSFPLALEAEELYAAVEVLQRVPAAFFVNDYIKRTVHSFRFPRSQEERIRLRQVFMLGRPRAREIPDQHVQATAYCQSGLILVPVNRLFGYTLSLDEAVSERFHLNRSGGDTCSAPEHVTEHRHLQT